VISVVNGLMATTMNTAAVISQKYWLKIKNVTSYTLHVTGLDFPSYKIGEKIVLLENIRFDSREIPTSNESGFRPGSVGGKNDEFAKELSSLGDIFINDAFSVSHRSHVSVVGIADFLPSYAGFAIKKEMENLDKLLSEPKKPFILILGGAKVYDKMMVLKNLLKKVSKDNTFLLFSLFLTVSKISFSTSLFWSYILLNTLIVFS